MCLCGIQTLIIHFNNAVNGTRTAVTQVQQNQKAEEAEKRLKAELGQLYVNLLFNLFPNLCHLQFFNRKKQLALKQQNSYMRRSVKVIMTQSVLTETLC